MIMKYCPQQLLLAQEIHESLLKIRKECRLPEIYELFSALTENCKRIVVVTYTSS
jgi:hypothetical protein